MEEYVFSNVTKLKQDIVLWKLSSIEFDARKLIEKLGKRLDEYAGRDGLERNVKKREVRAEKAGQRRH